jgi:putative protease
MTEGKSIGKVVHFYAKIDVAVVELESDLKLGDTVHITGAHTDFHQKIDSMQVEHEVVEQVSAGDEVAIKVKERVRVGDTLHLHVDE